MILLSNLGPTLTVILYLIIAALAAKIASEFVLKIAGLPGELMARTPAGGNVVFFVYGLLISAFGQSLVYLTYTAFVVSWTEMKARHELYIGFVLWPFAFYAVVAPLLITLHHARAKARQNADSGTYVWALAITTVVTVLAFYYFSTDPDSMKTLWGWMPFVERL